MEHFDDISILFWKDRVFLGKQSYLLGQVTTDILNLDGTLIPELRRRCDAFVMAARSVLERKGDQKLIPDLQRYLNAATDLIFTLPPYRDLPMDKYLMYHLFLVAQENGKWTQTMVKGSDAQQRFLELIRRFDEFPERLHTFREQISLMLEFDFENLPKRNSLAYGEAYAKYYASMIAGGGFFFPEQEFAQSFPVELDFVPMRNPEQELSDDPEQKIETVIAEKTRFSELYPFLYTDFYRGLAQGHIPRRCHNCGRYFLLSKGYNTFYCNNVAPGETTKTCRKVGAYRQADKKLKDPEHPERIEYNKAVGRVRTRKSRKKVDWNEYNELYRQAQEIKDRAERGELSDDEMQQLFKKI